MAEIRPLRAWRYNNKLSENIDELTSPLFDVVSEKHLQTLYKNPLNSIQISVPQGDFPGDTAARVLNEWKKEGIIKQDPLPGIYVYYQYYTLPGSHKEYCRKGFMANIKTYDWEEEVILRHENTIPGSVSDRAELLEKTWLHSSPTHGLYTDTSMELEKYLDESIQHPIYDTEDYQGVRDVLSVIHDGRIIKRFMEVLSSKQIILADGHHRYESSLHLKKKCMAANPNHTGNEGYNFHFMYFTNTEGQSFRILPTHRLVKNIEGFNKENLLLNLKKYFSIKPVANPNDLTEIILGKQWAFGLLLKDEAFKIRLKPEVYPLLDWKFPEVVKKMDLTVMHYFIFEKVLGIKGRHQRASPNISFNRDFMECYAKVMGNNAQMAVITSDISIEEVKQVCYSGYTMPQKSTYFYPKVICGFLFSSIKDDEFQSFHNPCF